MNSWTMIMEQEVKNCTQCPEFCVDAWRCVALKRDMPDADDVWAVSIPDDCPKLERNRRKP